MQKYSISFRELVGSQWRNRHLCANLIKREVLGRYRGSFLGLFWSFFSPLLMLCVYTFVFGSVLKAKWTGHNESDVEFALALFAGLMVFNVFSEVLIKSPAMILNNPNYVKRVIFPLEILPSVVVGSALFHLWVSLLAWLLAYGLVYGMPHLTVLLLPAIIIPIVLFLLGLSWILASLGVFLRDVAQITGIMATALMFLSPVFYPASAVPEGFRFLIYVNPVTPAIEFVRDVLYWGRMPDFAVMGTSTIVAAFVAWLGFAWFQKTRKGFADVI